jgi:hypothetical protein
VRLFDLGLKVNGIGQALVQDLVELDATSLRQID